ncbi:serine carboxypeptidase S28 [Colletotrichum asianum]
MPRPRPHSHGQGLGPECGLREQPPFEAPPPYCSKGRRAGTLSSSWPSSTYRIHHRRT